MLLKEGTNVTQLLPDEDDKTKYRFNTLVLHTLMLHNWRLCHENKLINATLF